MCVYCCISVWVGVSFCLCPCVSVFLSMCFSEGVCLCESVCVCVSLCECMFVCVCLRVFLSMCGCIVCLGMYVSV